MATVSTAESVYVIGGLLGGQCAQSGVCAPSVISKRVDEYRNGSWRNVDQLRSSMGRNLHSAIIIEDRLLVIGGYTCHNLAAAPMCRYNNQLQG